MTSNGTTHGTILREATIEPSVRFLREAIRGVDTPAFPEQVITEHCRKEPLCWFDGTALIVSGGHYALDRETGKEEILVFQNGVLGHRETIGKSFAERVIAALVEPEDDVAIYFPFANDMSPDWAEAAREAGVEVIEAGSRATLTGIRPDYTVCVGSGSTLPIDGLLNRCHSFAPYLVVTRGSWSAQMASMIQAARRGDDKSSILRHSVDYSDVAQLRTVWGSHRFEAVLGGPDGCNLVVTMRGSDRASVDRLMRRVAADLDVTLFNAGRLSDPDQNYEMFYEYPLWLRWSRLPSTWTMVNG